MCGSSSSRRRSTSSALRLSLIHILALVDANGAILGLRTYTNVYHRDSAYEDAQYFLPEEWAPLLLQGCRELCGEHPDVRIDAISAAGARQSFVLLNHAGEAFLGLPNIDNRGRDYMARVPEHDEIYRISGKWATEDFGAAKLLGLRQMYPERYQEVETVLSPVSYTHLDVYKRQHQGLRSERHLR